MQERLLQYIWRFQLYNSNYLFSVCGQPISIFYPGILNKDQGPDFLNADVAIGKIRWAGHVELHVLSSDWKKHQHDLDANYNNVVLHVVWEHDMELNLPFPTLELKSIVPKLLLEKYEVLMKGEASIPCKSLLKNVDGILIEKCKENMIVERLEIKSKKRFFLDSNNPIDWEEYIWRAIAAYFGGKVNGVAFELMAEQIPYKLLLQNRYDTANVEALLLGTCGLLDREFKEEYPQMLKVNYEFLSKKYGLNKMPITVHFLRMRPAGFPTLRLSQLSQLLLKNEKLFSTMINANELDELKSYFDVNASNYWNEHYVFEAHSSFREKRLGSSAILGIITNVAVVLNYAYGVVKEREDLKQKAIDWLSQLQPEQNQIIRLFKSLSFEMKSAYDTQAVAHLYNGYCLHKKCMQCAIGYALLRNAS
jgi:hypothetical protein